MGLGRRSKPRDRHVFQAGVHFIFDKSFQARANVTLPTGDVFVRRRFPTVDRGTNGMTGRAKLGMVGDWNGCRPGYKEDHDSDQEDDDGPAVHVKWRGAWGSAE